MSSTLRTPRIILNMVGIGSLSLFRKFTRGSDIEIWNRCLIPITKNPSQGCGLQEFLAPWRKMAWRPPCANSWPWQWQAAHVGLGCLPHRVYPKTFLAEEVWLSSCLGWMGRPLRTTEFLLIELYESCWPAVRRFACLSVWPTCLFDFLPIGLLPEDKSSALRKTNGPQRRNTGTGPKETPRGCRWRP